MTSAQVAFAIIASVLVDSSAAMKRPYSSGRPELAAPTSCRPGRASVAVEPCSVAGGPHRLTAVAQRRGKQADDALVDAGRLGRGGHVIGLDVTSNVGA